MVQTKMIKGYRIGSSIALTSQQFEGLLALINQVSAKPVKTLGGRGMLSWGKIEGIGPVVVKHYRRGGLLRKLLHGAYLRVSRSRSLVEYESLVEAASIGVRVPEPVAWVDRGAVIYRAWLVTKEIKGHRSLAELALSASNSASLSEISKVLEELGRQVELLIQNRLLHVDLHPGNVVVDQHGQVYILDFDKARKFTGGIRELRDQYLRRWRRAVIKHNLPDSLSENMCFHLKRDTLQLQ